MCQDGCISTLYRQRWVHLAAKVKNMTHKHTHYIHTLNVPIRLVFQNQVKYTYGYTMLAINMTMNTCTLTSMDKRAHTVHYSRTIRHLTFNIFGYIMEAYCSPSRRYFFAMQ